MAEADRFMFDHKELAEALIRHQGIREGLWGISVEFTLAATNVPTGADGKTISPAAINIVQRIGIQRFPEGNNLTVDAAKVNSKGKTTKTKTTKSRPKGK